VEQRIVIKFLVGENVPSAEIHHRLQQQYVEECLLRRHSSTVYYKLLTVTYVAEHGGNSLLLFHDNSDYTSVPQCYVICIWTVLFMLIFMCVKLFYFSLLEM